MFTTEFSTVETAIGLLDSKSGPDDVGVESFSNGAVAESADKCIGDKGLTGDSGPGLGIDTVPFDKTENGSSAYSIGSVNFCPNPAGKGPNVHGITGVSDGPRNLK